MNEENFFDKCKTCQHCYSKKDDDYYIPANYVIEKVVESNDMERLQKEIPKETKLQ